MRCFARFDQLTGEANGAVLRALADDLSPRERRDPDVGSATIRVRPPGSFLHYIIDRNPRGYPGKFVLRAVTIGTMYSRVVVAADTLEAARERIPPGYANTGKPDGPTMLEVWV